MDIELSEFIVQIQVNYIGQGGVVGFSLEGMWWGKDLQEKWFCYFCEDVWVFLYSNKYGLSLKGRC